MFDMFGKLGEMKEKMEAVKQKLDTIMVKGASPSDLVIVEMTANKRATAVTVNPNLLNDAEQLEDMLVIAMNRAIENAEATAESEMKSATAGLLPNIPGLF